MSDYEESLPVPPRTEDDATIEYNDAKQNKGYGNSVLWGVVRRLLDLFDGMGKRKERDAAALRIYFDRDFYGNHSSTSTECPFCPLGLNCKRVAIAIEERRALERIKNKLDEADAGADIKAYFEEGVGTISESFKTSPDETRKASLIEKKKALSVMVTHGEELRIFDQFKKKYCGWFTDIDKMADIDNPISPDFVPDTLPVPEILSCEYEKDCNSIRKIEVQHAGTEKESRTVTPICYTPLSVVEKRINPDTHEVSYAIEFGGRRVLIAGSDIAQKKGIFQLTGQGVLVCEKTATDLAEYLVKVIALNYIPESLVFDRFDWKENVAFDWTEGIIIQFLGEPEEREEKPYAPFGAPILLYRMMRVLAIENREEFRVHKKVGA